MSRGKHWTNKEKARVSAMLAINLKPKDMAMHVDRTPHAITLYVTKHPEIRNTAAMLELLDAEIRKERAGPEATPVQEKPQKPQRQSDVARWLLSQLLSAKTSLAESGTQSEVNHAG